jgi:glutamate-ammonia-ligase adenylyltransferase
MQLEFYTQALQMAGGVWEPNTLRALVLVAPRENAPVLANAYLFLRKIETVLRRSEDTAISRIPADSAEQERLAKRCGFADRSGLLKANESARATIARYARLDDAQA